MIKNKVLEQLTVGDYVSLFNGVPMIAREISSGEVTVDVMPADQAEEILACSAEDMFAVCLKIAPNVYRGKLHLGGEGILAMLEITEQNRELICLYGIARIFNEYTCPAKEINAFEAFLREQNPEWFISEEDNA